MAFDKKVLVTYWTEGNTGKHERWISESRIVAEIRWLKKYAKAYQIGKGMDVISSETGEVVPNSKPRF